MSSRWILAGAVVLGLVFVAVWLTGGNATSTDEAGTKAAGIAESAKEHGGSAPASTPVESQSAARPGVEAPDESAPKRDRRSADERRERLRQAIPPREVDPANPAPGTAVFEKEYLRAVIMEDIVPVAQECYQQELEDDPEMEGKVKLEFTVLADQEIGGVVEDASVMDDGTTIESEDLRECLAQATMAIELDPPERGSGRMTVQYAIVMTPDPNE